MFRKIGKSRKNYNFNEEEVLGKIIMGRNYENSSKLINRNWQIKAN